MVRHTKKIRKVNRRKHKKSYRRKIKKNRFVMMGGMRDFGLFQVLKTYNSNINGKRILDIGSRDGLNCISLAVIGASEVIGIDLDNSRFNEIESDREYPSVREKITLLHQDLLTMGEEYNHSFDTITCFLWNINIPQYNLVMEKIKSLLKPDGIVIIGIHDHLYKYGYVSGGISSPNTGSVPELINNNFNKVYISKPSTVNQWLIKASEPK
jgi:2-polyprenyl-3-methyl-5-hydroxy-6-metoxy-1,4-benzoquinol methylase